MTKVQFSPIITAVRKKLGNVVFTANRFGPVMRKRVKGINPKSAAQQTVRSDFSAATKNFASIGATDQGAWDSAASTVTKTDIFGKSYTNTGAQLQTQVNTVRQLVGLGLASTPPATGGLHPALAASVAGDGSTGVVTVTTAAQTVSSGWYLIYTTAGLKSSQTFIGSKYRLGGIVATVDAATTAVCTPKNWNAKLAFIATQDVAVKVVYVDINGYKVGTWYGRFTAS